MERPPDTAKQPEISGTRFVLQIILDCFAFIFAVFAAALFLSWGYLVPANSQGEPMQIAAAIGSAIVSSAILGAAVFVPALIAIAAAEIFRWRSLFYFVGAGGALGFVVWNVGAADHATNLRPGTTVALASGFIGGFVYWIVAGRTSGSWAAAKRGN